jgi:hypothetical protein
MSHCAFISQSPCTSVARDGLPATRADGKTGCAESLAAAAKQRNLRFQFLVRNYYQPSIKGSDKASVTVVKELVKTGSFAFSLEKISKIQAGTIPGWQAPGITERKW